METGASTAGWLAGEGLEFLSAAERESLAGLRNERRRAEWLLGRWASKHLILASGKIDPEMPKSAISILNEPGGAPYAVLDSTGQIPGCLSISHRSGVAACAWTVMEQVRIGMDIELVEKRDPSFLREAFTPSEQAYALALQADKRELWETLAWCAKETVLKAIRTGLRIDTRRVHIGGVRGLFKPESNRSDWNTLSVSCDAVPDGRWWGGWQKRGECVITLVVLGGDLPPVLQEI